MPQTKPETPDALVAALNRFDATLAAFDAVHGSYEPLSEEKRELLHERLIPLSDADLVGYLLAIHKTVERAAPGRVREWAELEAVILTTALDRFAPVALYDTLAVWEEEERDADDEPPLTVEQILEAS